MREFVAEQYISAEAIGAAARNADAARRAAEQLTRRGTLVQVVHSIFIPEDETCIHLYRADSIEAVQVAVTRAALQLDRVVEAVTWAPAIAAASGLAATRKHLPKGSDHVTQQK